MEGPANSPKNLAARLAMVPGKLRKRGGGWLFMRIREEAVCQTQNLLSLIKRTFRCFVYFCFNLHISKQTLFAVYDLESYPISYDILWFLVWTDIERKKRGFKYLQCIFIPCHDDATRKYPEGYDAVVDSQSRAWRFQNICIPAVSLLPDSGVAASSGRTLTETLASMASTSMPRGRTPDLPTIYRQTTAGLTAQGTNWQGLSASVQGRRYVEQWLKAEVGDRKPVVITLRQYGVDVERNSALDEWVAFADSLDRNVYCPVIVPDTDNSFGVPNAFSGTPFFPHAAWNVGLRMALYEMAYLNMFVNSGPGSLCMLNRQCRYIFFKVVAPTHLASVETLRQMGFERNTSPAFATPLQKWVWDPDNREVLRREFDAMVTRIEATPRKQEQ